MTNPTRPLQHVPRLRYRTLRLGDLEQSLQLLPPHIGLDDGQLARLPALWQRLAQEPSILTGTIEDTALSAGQNVQAWGVTMALPQPQPLVQALDLEGSPRGHLVRRIYAGLLAGEVQLMSDRDLGRANLRGELVLMILHFSMRAHDLNDSCVHQLIATAKIFDDSDAALMAQLEVSTHGLKKLWRGVYDRIEDTAPEFFGDAVADDDGKRGPEKRRQVLAYLRQRPDELRPWARG